MRKVTRLKEIRKIFGCGQTTVDELIASGQIRVFPLTPKGRAKVAYSDELDAYLERQAKKSKDTK